MKLFICLALTLLVGCAQPQPPTSSPERESAEIVEGAPRASLSVNGPAVSHVQEVSSIQGVYVSHSGGLVEIQAQGAARLENIFGKVKSRGKIVINTAGASLLVEKEVSLPVKRYLLGLWIGNEVLVRRDAKLMFHLPQDPRLVGRFVSPQGTQLISVDGQVFDYLPSAPQKRSEWKRYLHIGNYKASSDAGVSTGLIWLHSTPSPVSLPVQILPSGALRLGSEVLERSTKSLHASSLAGRFTDSQGNSLDLSTQNEVSFKLKFPGKANAIQASGTVYPIHSTMASVVSDEVGKPFLFTVRQMKMGHVLVYLPSAVNSSPLVLLASPSAQKESVPSELIGFYLNPDAYDLSIDPSNKLVLSAKGVATDPEKTEGAVSKKLIGIDLLPKGQAKLFYDQGPALSTLVEHDTNGTLSFYFMDYKDQPLYQAGQEHALLMKLSMPSDGFKQEKVPTIEQGDERFRHYPTAYKDILANTFEQTERTKDEALAKKLEADPDFMLSAYDAQAERERRMRRRHDARLDGVATPDVGEFFASKHQARVLEMNQLIQELTHLPMPRNASELRANMAREREIRARATELQATDERERQSAP